MQLEEKDSGHTVRALDVIPRASRLWMVLIFTWRTVQLIIEFQLRGGFCSNLPDDARISCVESQLNIHLLSIWIPLVVELTAFPIAGQPLQYYGENFLPTASSWVVLVIATRCHRRSLPHGWHAGELKVTIVTFLLSSSSLLQAKHARLL